MLRERTEKIDYLKSLGRVNQNALSRDIGDTMTGDIMERIFKFERIYQWLGGRQHQNSHDSHNQ